jgi:hypothetical protein
MKRATMANRIINEFCPSTYERHFSLIAENQRCKVNFAVKHEIYFFPA